MFEIFYSQRIANMKSCPLLSIACLLAFGVLPSGAQQLNWGSAAFSDFADSRGAVLDNTFVFEIGAFNAGFVPNSTNIDSWQSNWKVFDRAAYNGIEQPVDDGISGYITGTARMLDNGRSDSLFMTPGAPSFEGLSGYLWVRKGDNPVPGSEWLLTRANAWVFPTAIPGCCDNDTPFEWAISDMGGGDVPKWGKQGVVAGPGEFMDPSAHTLQTYTFVPEPSSAVMVLLAGSVMVLRRRRLIG
jgi:hypothetical protein